MNDSNGNEKLGGLTKKVLYKVASKLENSDDVTLHMESGSQNGMALTIDQNKKITHFSRIKKSL